MRVPPAAERKLCYALVLKSRRSRKRLTEIMKHSRSHAAGSNLHSHSRCADRGRMRRAETIRRCGAEDRNIRLGAGGDPRAWPRQAGRPLDSSVIELASPEAGKIALRAGSADIIVSDWLWVSRERGLGAKLTFYPYSSALGAVMVPNASPIRNTGRSQGPHACRRRRPDRQKLAAAAGVVEAGRHRPEVGGTSSTARRRCWRRRRSSGEMDATLNYWNFCAALEAKGFRRLAGIEDILPKLGAKGRTAMIGYVFDEGWAQRKPRRGGALHRDDPQGEGDFGDLGRGVGENRAADRRHRRRNPARLSRSLSRGNSRAARSPTRKPTRAFSTACWRRSAAANLSGRRKNSIPAHSIARSRETEVLRLLSFAVFLATWWIAALLAGGAKLPPPPAVLDGDR